MRSPAFVCKLEDKCVDACVCESREKAGLIVEINKSEESGENEDEG